MQVKCLNCGHALQLDDRTYASYMGPVKCNTCRTVVHVSIHDRQIQGMALFAPEAV